MTTRPKEFNQLNVSNDPEKNKRLSDKDRIENLEGDVIHMADAIDTLIIQNNRYADYLDTRITAQRETAEFWRDVRKKLVTSGIWGTIVIIGGALYYAVTQYIKTH